MSDTIQVKPAGTDHVAALVEFNRAMARESEDKGLDEVVLARGLSIAAPAWSLAVLAALGAVISLVPITVLGIGTRDALYVAAAPFLGATAESMLALSLLLLGMYVFNSITGWAAWFLSPPRDRRPPSF